MRTEKADLPTAVDEVLLYRSSGIAPLRVLTAVSLVFALASTVLATMLLESNVRLNHSVSLEERIVWAGGLLIAFVGFFLAVWLYEQRVAANIVLSGDGRVLRVATPTLFGMRERNIPLTDLLATQFHDGDGSGEDATSPPWLWVKVRKSGSFVVPLSGEIPDRSMLLEVLSAPLN